MVSAPAVERQKSHEDKFTTYIRQIFGHDTESGNESLLDNLYDYSKQNGIGEEASKKYPVYQPKSSSEYFSVLLRHPLVKESESFAYKVARTRSQPESFFSNLPMEQDRYKLSFDARRFTPPDGPHNFVIDYSSVHYPKSEATYKPLSRPLYKPKQEHYHNEDSRHLCSDFVMLSVRKPGAWFDRVDRLLREAKTRA